jgi:hypothetical protein
MDAPVITRLYASSKIRAWPRCAKNSPSSAASIHPMRVTKAMFDRMLEAGIFSDDVRVELLDGQLFEKEDMK